MTSCEQSVYFSREIYDLKYEHPHGESQNTEQATDEKTVADVIRIVEPVLEKNHQYREDQKILGRQNTGGREFSWRQFQVTAHKHSDTVEAKAENQAKNNRLGKRCSSSLLLLLFFHRLRATSRI